MINPGFLLVLMLSISASSPAQVFRYTLPQGMLNRGGDWDDGEGSPYVLSYGTLRYQEVHTSWTGKGAKVLSCVAFRRAWNKPYTGTAGARTVDITFTIGPGNLHQFYSTSFAGNYKSTPTVVHPKKTVNLPSWVQRPTNSPARFDAIIPFARPAIYIDTADMLWDIELTNASTPGGGYYCDRQVAAYGSAPSQMIGQGCVAAGRSKPIMHIASVFNAGPAWPMRMQLSVLYNPNAPVTLAIGLKGVPLPVPGWCTTIGTTPLVYVPLGTPSTINNVVRGIIDFPHSPGLVGTTFYSQAFAKDTNAAGISLSNACRNQVPRPPIPQSWKYVLAAGSNPTRIEGPHTVGSVVTGWY
jgi:hypothetical protein